jgi:hypothetical protein
MIGSLALAALPSLDAPAAEGAVHADRPNAVAFAPQAARFVRFVIRANSSAQPCIDELEIYGPGGTTNLALVGDGAKATASSCLPGHAIHRVAHLNDGRYGNANSWIAASGGEEWAQIELARPAPVARVVFSRDREGRYHDRVPTAWTVQLSDDGAAWRTVATGARRPRRARRRCRSPTRPRRRRWSATPSCANAQRGSG